MHPYKCFVRVLALVLICGGGVRADDPADTEPNDTLEDAVDTGLSGEGTVTIAGGVIGNGDYPERDVDLYRFDIPAESALPKLLTVSAVGSASLDGYLRLFDAAGLEIANNDEVAYPDLDPLLRTYLLEEGSYYVGLSASGNALYDPTEAGSGMDNPTEGAYDLTITVEAADPLTSELEPNDDFATATDTGGAAYEVSGEFIGDGVEARLDLDLYRVTLSEPAIIQVDAGVEHLDSTLDPMLSLRSAGGTHAINDDANLDTRDAHIEAAVFDPGDYYVVVGGAGNYLPIFDASLRAPGSVGYYDLAIDVTPIADPGGPYECNDSLIEATPSGLSGPGEVTFSAYLGDGRFAATRGDVDVYEVWAYWGEVLTVDVDAAVLDSELDSVIVAYDYLGRILGANDNDGATTDSYLTMELGSWDTYYPPLYVMVLGTRQLRPPTPLVPCPGSPDSYLSEHIVSPAASSTGAYDVTIQLEGSPQNDCCVPSSTPGCDDPEIEACVCALDPFCCAVAWDELCVEEVETFGCGSCEDKGGYRDTERPSLPPLAPPPPTQPGSRRLFATELTFPADTIVEIDPADGSLLNSFSIPADFVHTNQGVAVLDDTLFYLGTGRFPKLYWLDPDTGDLLDEMFLWSGSGYYGDLAVLSGQIYLTDLLERSLHELDPLTLHVLRTIPVGAINDITLSGATAALAHPNRIYLADAFDSGAIHAIDPTAGDLDASMSVGASCPCNADFDGDGDVDALDQMFFDDCDAGDGSVRYACRQVDLDCDGDRDADDEAILDCQHNGPGVPPHEGCCPDDLPPVPVRATALGGSGSARLYVNDCSCGSVEICDQTGMLLYVWPMGMPLGAIGGQPFFPFGDADDDGDVDLIDFLLFTDCLTGPEAGPVVSTCCMFDAEPDGDVDLDDFAAFQIAFTQGP